MSENKEILCDGSPCLHQGTMKRWNEKISKWDGAYPDPIDNSPCDHCIKSK